MSTTKPVNLNTDNGVPVSSNCVIWDGPDITSVGLCRGQPITRAMYTMANRIIALEDIVNIANYDVSCLTEVQSISDFKDLIQAIITKSCT